MTSPSENEAIRAHVVPFAAWILVMLLTPGDPAAWKYALRSAACVAALAWLRPWRWYPPLRWRFVPGAAFVGLLVFAVWALPESRWAGRWPALQDVYVTWAVWPMGSGREPLTATPYAPDVCGWPWTLARLAGSALVIPVAEEVFWRGFLYRWIHKSRFLEADVGRLNMNALLIVSVLFGLEHREWLAGVFAGLAYGLLMIRTGSLWAAIIAHMITNALLGVYVILTGAYYFW